ncbi:MAG TPA: tetratricopeptide repeat protein [Gammaproteobacteria bacterium]|nr:tetratricopeptide repeat protein [Gammaproteobacteria bacterium]
MKRFIARSGHASLAAALLVWVQPAIAHDHAGSGRTEVGAFTSQASNATEAYIDSKPPLWKKLGTLSYAVTTTHQLAQKYFDQGLRLAYAFNHLEARRAFRQAQRLDPNCAMCYWGEALVLGPNINAPMESEAIALAVAALGKAKKASHRVSVKERVLIKALAARYSEDPKAERKALDAAYAEAMRRAKARFPNDQEIAVLYAEALMDLSPWDYWQEGGRLPKGKTARIIKTLEGVLARNPNHPGAIHYYIHLVEASDRPERAVPYAERLGRLMPGAGHLVHMPGHIYYRLGRYLDALAASKAAIAVDEAYLKETGARGLYADGYYPHNLHFLLVSAQMAGDGKTVVDAAQRLAQAISAEAMRKIPWLQPVRAAPYFAHAQFSAPDTVLALADPGDEFPYVKALWRYARGMAHTAQGQIEAAQAENRAMAAIERQADFATLLAGGVPVKEVLGIARHVVAARIAQARGDLKDAEAEFEAAITIEDRLPYMEPPYWYYPIRQSLGAVLLMAGQLDHAEAVFQASLKRTPNNGWALYGLREVYEKRGDESAARAVEERLTRTWAGDRRRLDLARL